MSFSPRKQGLSFWSKCQLHILLTPRHPQPTHSQPSARFISRAERDKVSRASVSALRNKEFSTRELNETETSEACCDVRKYQGKSTFLNGRCVGVSTRQMGHLPKCQLLIACLPHKTEAPTSHLRGARSSMYLQWWTHNPFPLSLLRMWCLPSKINTNEIISASPEIPREGTQQNQWKILEGYKLHIKVLELWERWKNSRCKTRQGADCIKTIKIYNCFNGQLFFAFVHGFEFAWGCQMPWKGVLLGWMGVGEALSLSVLPLLCFVNATFPSPTPEMF